MHRFSGSLLVVLNNNYEFFAQCYAGNLEENPDCKKSKEISKNIKSLVMLERKQKKRGSSNMIELFFRQINHAILNLFLH